MGAERTRPGSVRRARFMLGTVFLAISMVLLIVGLASATFAAFGPRGGNAAASFLRPQPGSLRWDGRQRVTMLLIGAQGTATPAGSFLVASLDGGAHTIRLLEIPANLWVTVPGFGQMQLASAYADGGPSLAVLTVESVLQM